MSEESFLFIIPLAEESEDLLVKGILDNVKAPIEEDKFRIYDWKIDNKYYQADIKVCVTLNPSHVSAYRKEKTDALVVVFDPNQEEHLIDIENKIKCWDDIDPEVKLLVCDSFGEENSSTKLNVQKWCIANEWELVVLEPEDIEEDTDLEDDFKDSYGFQRIKQALHANTWSNLQMKDSKGLTSLMQHINLDGGNSSEDETPYSPLEENMKETISHKDIEGTMTDADDLDKLFSSFSSMKAKASSMPAEERRRYAEHVTMAFWRAMGGDEEEISNLDD